MVYFFNLYLESDGFMGDFFNLYLESDGFLGDVPQLPGRLVVLSLRLGLLLLAVSVVLAALGIP